MPSLYKVKVSYAYIKILATCFKCLNSSLNLGLNIQGLINEGCEHNCATLSDGKGGINLFTASELHRCGDIS